MVMRPTTVESKTRRIGCGTLEISERVFGDYQAVFTKPAIDALDVLAPFDLERRRLMQSRLETRAGRAESGLRIDFLDAHATIAGTSILVQDARDGRFEGAPIPADLQRQWVQGTGPGARPNVALKDSIRNVAYALLSGADGWMFDGEDALGQVSTMSLDNQRNLSLAIDRHSVFLEVAEHVARQMNSWSSKSLGYRMVEDWREQLNYSTVLFRPRGLHLDDRHVRASNGTGFSASIVDLALYVTHNQARLRGRGSTVVFYLPKIQTAEEAGLWNRLLESLEEHLALPIGTFKAYVLVEQIEASFQLMEIRAALGKHFVGYNTGRWDYINSVSDAMSWAPDFINPNIDAIGMTFGYMRNYEDRVRRAVNTADANGNFALWQGGMEPNIPVGSDAGVDNGMNRAVAGGIREREAGASGKWVAHWKMVPIVRKVWKAAGVDNQLGRHFPQLSYTSGDADGLLEIDSAPRTVRGARDLISVALQYGNAFEQGFQAVALKPADSFADDDMLYLMEDMATGEIRLSILWEWLHKGATLTEDDDETATRAGDPFTEKLFLRLIAEEYDKLLQAADRNVHEDSKRTTLPIARATVSMYVTDSTKVPWGIDLLNLNLNNHDQKRAVGRIRQYMSVLRSRGTRITENLDFY